MAHGVFDRGDGGAGRGAGRNYGQQAAFFVQRRASAVGTLLLLVNIPAYLQPFMGGLSDLYPLFGWHRRTYFAGASVVQAAGYAGLMSLHHYHYAALVCLLLVAGSGSAIAAVLVNAVMVSVGNRSGRFGQLQSLSLFIPLALSIAYTGDLDGYVTQN